MSSMQVPPGGPSAIHGIEYQMLWSLFRAASWKVQKPEYDGTGALDGFTLILETSSGADVETQAGRLRIVEQVKARSTGTPWSLGEVIAKVLSNLFRSVRRDVPSTFRFVTEGPMSDWGDLYGFFQSLKSRVFPANGDPIAVLDDTPFPSRHSQLAAKIGQPLTERSLFLHLARTMHGGGEPTEETFHQLWLLLGNFEFLGDQPFENLVRDIDQSLTNVGVPAEGVAHKRQELLGALLSIAGSGDGRVDPRRFLEEHGLAAVALTRWTNVLERSRRHLVRCLHSLGYDRELDVRETGAGSETWNEEVNAENREVSQRRPPVRRRPAILFTGESGQGKSWRLFRLAHELSGQGQVVILIRASGSVVADCEEAAQSFCREVWGTIYRHSLTRLSELVRAQLPQLPRPWLTVLIDGVQDERYAIELLQFDWMGAEARVGLTCPWREGIESEIQARIIPVSDFTHHELSRYLKARLGDAGIGIPHDVRDILKRPLFARLFCDLHDEDPTWRPADEYQLFERSWRRYASRAPLATGALAALASRLPEDKIYPWSLGQIWAAGLRDPELLALRDGSGLIRITNGGRSLEIWHDRILNWVVAEGLVVMLRSSQITTELLLGRLLSGDPAEDPINRRLGYVLMDTFWILLTPGFGLDQTIDGLLIALEEHWDEHDMLRHLETLESRIVPYLFTRIRKIAPFDEKSPRAYVKLLQRLEDPTIPSRAAFLLQSPDRSLQEVAVEILTAQPSVEALDRLWQLRCELEGDGERLFVKLEIDHALQACVRKAPDWLLRAIRRSDPRSEPFDALVYLLPFVAVEDGKRIWEQVRDEILEKIEGHDRRAVVNCIESFDDQEAAEWLRKQIHREDDLAAPAALRAFERLQPERVLEDLEKVDIDSMSFAFARSWWLPQLLATQFERTSEILLSKIRSHPKPWIAAAVYDNRENLISPGILDFLLDETGMLLAQEVATPSPPDKRPLYRPFHFLSEVSRPDLLSRFEARRGTPFEDQLTEVLLHHGPNDGGGRRWEVEYGLSVLYKIGGNGFTRVANQYLLDAKTRLGLRDALLLEIKRPDSAIFPRIAELASGSFRGDEKEQDFPLVQYEAVKALAALHQWTDLVRGVVRLGLKTPRGLPEYLEGRTFTDEEIKEALADLRSGVPSPGALLALGFSKRVELAPEIRSIFAQSDRESDRALACLLALEALEDRSEETEALFMENLGSPQNGYVAWRALLTTVRTARAYEALLEQLRHLREVESGSRQLLAMNLLLIEETRERAARILWQELERRELLWYTGDTVRYLACLDTPEVREFLREVALSEEGGVWHSGDRHGAIQGVATFDRDAAFDAAHALYRSEHRNRELSPETLLELAATKALPIFEETLASREDFLLIAAIGEALDRHGLTGPILQWLASPGPGLRQGACFIAESLQWVPELEEALLRCLRDPDWDVRVAARTALEHVRLARETALLVEAVHVESDPVRRWVLVDATLDLGYPGVVAGYGAKSWFGRMLQGLPFAVRSHALSRLEEKRKELRNKLSKRERD